ATQEDPARVLKMFALRGRGTAARAGSIGVRAARLFGLGGGGGGRAEPGQWASPGGGGRSHGERATGRRTGRGGLSGTQVRCALTLVEVPRVARARRDCRFDRAGRCLSDRLLHLVLLLAAFATEEAKRTPSVRPCVLRGCDSHESPRPTRPMWPVSPAPATSAA